jgi:hypothetical protein
VTTAAFLFVCDGGVWRIARRALDRFCREQRAGHDPHIGDFATLVGTYTTLDELIATEGEKTMNRKLHLLASGASGTWCRREVTSRLITTEDEQRFRASRNRCRDCVAALQDETGR